MIAAVPPIDPARLVRALTSDGRPLYALLDAAREPRVLEVVRASGHPHRSLLDGPRAEALAEHAPYLVRLERGSPLLGALIAEGWGRAWGIYVTSDAGFRELLVHLQRFTRVTDQAGNPLFFRFYDPRVLRAFLPTCPPRQVDLLFAEVGAYLMESQRVDALLSFTAGADHTVTRAELPLGAEGGA